MATSTIPMPNVVGGVRVANIATGNNTTFTVTLATGNTQTLYIFLSTRWPPDHANYRESSAYNLVYNGSSAIYILHSFVTSGLNPVTLSVSVDSSKKVYTFTTNVPHVDALVIGTQPFTLS